MKIKAIAALMKKKRRISIFDDEKNGVQWISDGYAAYPLYGLPELDGDTLLTVLDVPEKEREKYIVRRGMLPRAPCFSDTDGTERRLPPPALISIGYGGEVLAPARTSLGLAFYNPEYLRPVSDGPFEMYERESAEGKMYLAVKSGFLLRALILPGEPNEEDIAQRLELLHRELISSISRKAMESRKKTPEDQYSLAVDPETGEIME